MTFVSYAQNFEDVMLWRALRGVERGFYIDVGAADPDADSVTRAFYDRDWSGINVEPVARSMRRIAAARLRDVNLEVALGREPGSAVLHVVEGTGLSTLVAENLAQLQRAGYASGSAVVEVTTLAEICRAHVAGRAAGDNIHFLKIDAEGAEEAVLAGADFVRFRPWIVLVEATAPMSAGQTHAGWEPILLAADYRFVYFDGLNRFYVAVEHIDALAPCFDDPPNVFDDFIRAADTEWARRVADAESRVAIEAAVTASAEARTRDAAAAAAQAAVLAMARAREIEALRTAHTVELKHLRDRLAESEAWSGALRGSTSWRVTAPLRLAVGMARRGLKHVPDPALNPPPRAAGGMADGSAVAASPPRRYRAVHQFHSGSAVGDAITNAMLLTRRLLRSAGYASEIYVEHLDPLLAGDLRTMDALPAHQDYVLIVRHSMGYDAFDRIAALPVPKILIYHNITPPELLENDFMRHHAGLGRLQLARLRPLVAASLADSDYNAIELRRLGFKDARTCTLLFDLEALRAKAARRTTARRNDRFTILFVGRVGVSKGQLELLAAYARFRQLHGGPSRLVLVGRHGGARDPVIGALGAGIAAERLEDHVVVTGLVSEAELHDWYCAADLYVSLSRHEGFGVPLVEAMAYGVPVLARPSGAVPYTLHGAAELIEDVAPEAVATRMLGLALDPARRTAMAARQLASLDRFAPDRQIIPLLRALATAGALPPEDAGIEERLADNMRFTIAGHVNGSYSLAAINRDLAQALESARPGGVRIIAVEGQPTDDLSGVPDGERVAIAALSRRGPPETGPELVISQHYPVYLPAERGDIRTALFFWEESLVPAATIARLDAGFDGVLAATTFVAKALIDSGLSIPVRVVGHSPNLAAFERLRSERASRAPTADGTFSFLHVSSGFPRKGIDVLLAAYARAFHAGDRVRLVIKVFPNPHNDAARQLADMRARHPGLGAPGLGAPGLGAIELIDRDIPLSAMLELYRHADAVVLPTRGEGFNIPAAEAMAAGIPVIVTGFGGHMDFCAADNARLLDFRFVAASTHLSPAHSLWAEPDEDDLVAALRAVFADPAASAARTRRARGAVAKLADGPGLLRRYRAAGVNLLLSPKVARLRVAWISTWDVRCGVAEYSRGLVDAMTAAHPDLDVSVLCDHRTVPRATDGPVAVKPTWDLGHHGWSVPQIVLGIGIDDPRVVVIQHQPGLLPWNSLGDLLGSPALAGRIVVVALHNTLHLLETGPMERARAVAALGGAGRVLVHTPADLNVLKDLGLVANVTLLPHGASPAVPAPPPRRLTVSDAPLIGCYGFFLPGKGIGALIEAVAGVRQRWPRAGLRLVNADYGTPGAAAEMEACRRVAERLGVPVDWRTEFLPRSESLSLLAGCDVIVLPYQASRESSSAALRGALGAGRAVAVTPLPLFDEAGNAVLRFDGVDAGQMATGLERLLGDVAAREILEREAVSWLADRDWAGVGTRLGGMLRGLAVGAETPVR